MIRGQVRLAWSLPAAGHYQRALITAGVWPEGWQVVELNPAHVSAQV
jgi:transposase